MFRNKREDKAIEHVCPWRDARQEARTDVDENDKELTALPIWGSQCLRGNNRTRKEKSILMERNIMEERGLEKIR